MQMTAIFDAYATYYDLFYRDKDYAGEARYVQELLTRQGLPSGSLLELGCGTGGHAQQLAQLGYRVHGIDVSPAMVERATRRITPGQRDRLHFQTGDARAVRLGAAFDAVIALFHVASYQAANEELAAMFTTAAAHLRAGGLLLFDFWYGPAVLTALPEVRVRRIEGEQHSIVRIAEPVLDANCNCVDVHYTVLVQERATSATRQFEETHRMRYLFLPELDLMLKSAGLRLLRAESWMGGKIGASSWQGLVVAVK